MSNMQFYDERAMLADYMKELWDRKLTNAAGGNASMRVGDGLMIVTPSMMSEHHHCDISPGNILLTDFKLNIIEGDGTLSRESRMHAMLLSNIPEIGAIIHAHPEYTMVFVSAQKPIPSVTEATQKMGDTGLIEKAKAYSLDLAEHVYEYFAPKREQLKNTGLCALMPLHGTVAVGKHLQQAFSVVERIETDAKCNLFGKLIQG